MIELVQRYYAGERHTAMLAAAIGVGLILLSLVLWRSASAATLARGSATVFLVLGLLQSAVGVGYGIVAGNRARQASTVYAGHAERDIKQQEIARMGRIVKSGYIGGLVMYTALLAAGLALLLLAGDAPKTRGVVLALMIVGVLGNGLEAWSMQANRQYLRAVEARVVM